MIAKRPRETEFTMSDVEENANPPCNDFESAAAKWSKIVNQYKYTKVPTWFASANSESAKVYDKVWDATEDLTRTVFLMKVYNSFTLNKSY